MREIVLAIGSNRAGAWGPPLSTMRQALGALASHGLGVTAVSPLLETAPLGPSRSRYLNAVICVLTDQTPAQVLRTLKRIEAAAGRRTRVRWSARALDIDIISDGGRILGWPGPVGRRRAGRHRAPPPASPALTVPHPRAHERAFVLVPLMLVRPKWRHPTLGRTARTLLLSVRNNPGDARVICTDWVSPSPHCKR